MSEGKKVRLTVRRSQAKTFADLQKLRNVGRARGRAVTIHNGGTATTHLPRKGKG